MTDEAEIEDVEARLRLSEANRAAMVERLGFVPLSLLRVSRGALHRSLYHFAGERGKATSKGRRAEKGGVFANARMKISGGGSRSAATPRHSSRSTAALSIMPAELVAFFARYYAEAGATYLDPFMGQGVQMQVAHRLGMHYLGYDLSTEFFQFIDAVRKRIDNGTTRIGITHGDSRTPTEIPDDVGDFGFTSPPYWDLEFYGEEEAQLGRNSYEDFLVGMEDVARAWLPKFKRGAVLVVNVNDFRKAGRFYPYHADTIRLFQAAGWELSDTWVIDSLVAGLPRAFAVSFNLKRIAPKVHEYALVFRRTAS